MHNITPCKIILLSVTSCHFLSYFPTFFTNFFFLSHYHFHLTGLHISSESSKSPTPSNESLKLDRLISDRHSPAENIPLEEIPKSLAVFEESTTIEEVIIQRKEFKETSFDGPIIQKTRPKFGTYIRNSFRRKFSEEGLHNKSENDVEKQARPRNTVRVTFL